MLRSVSLRRFCCAILIVIAPVSASALSLREAIARARTSDPAFLTARANLEAAQARSDQALAGLLPQLSANANTNSNRRNYETRHSPLPEEIDHYNSNSAQISLTQPLWRRANQIALTQADHAVSQAAFQLVAAEQDLLTRLAQAWFDLMQADDAVVYADRQLAAAHHQWEQSRRAGEIDLLAAPAVAEARAKYEQAVAEQMAAESERQVKLAALEQIIGPTYVTALPSLSGKYAPADLHSGALEKWLAHAEGDNPNILAASRALGAAGDEVRKQRAGHHPTLDAVASYGRNSQAVGGFPGQSGYDIKQGSVGLQLSIPLYAGGGQSAKVREALAGQEKAVQDLETAKRNTRAMVKQAWFGWQASKARQAAAAQAVKYTSLALNQAETGKVAEVKTELDVLQARQQLYGAVRDFNRARYEMITSNFKLEAALGRLTEDALMGVDPWLESAVNP